LATGQQTAVPGDGFPYAISPDGTLAAIGLARFELVDLRKNAPGALSDAKSAWASDVSLSSAGDRAVTNGHYAISAWEADSGQRAHSIEISPYRSDSPGAALSPDGRYAAIFEGDYKAPQIVIWDVATRRAVQTLRPSSGAQGVTAVSFSPDSSRVTTYQPFWRNQGAITIWDIVTGKELQSFKEAKTFAGYSGVPRLSVDNKTLIIAGRDVVGFDIATSNELYKWRMARLPSSTRLMMTDAGGKPAVQEAPSAWRALAISSDGAVAGGILWGDDFGSRRTENRIVLCDGKTGRILGRMDDSGKATSGYEAVSFSPDGRLFVTTDNTVVYLWEVATRKEVRRLEGHRGDVRSVSFSLNGRRLATSSGDSTCLIWDVGRVVDAQQPLAKPATAKQIAAWWDDLLSAEPRTAYAAIWRLSEAARDVIPFLNERLRPVTKEHANQIAAYVTEATSSRYGTKLRASCTAWAGWLSRLCVGRWRRIRRLKLVAAWSNC
jgi:WD40 repeat protein